MGNNNNNVEIPTWLKGLPLAPEFRPTDTEFADPIAYISRIEKEASAFGICKIIPPFPKPSKKYVFNNLNKSLSKCPELGSDVNLSNVSDLSKAGSGSLDCLTDGEVRALFTTRHQELGQSAKKTKGVVNNDNPQLGVHKQVWQSGEVYTLDQFESKSKAFARSLLGTIKEISPLVIEALFWKVASEKPIYVEYANDVPGSGFGEPEGQFRYFHRRRRKMTSWKSYRNRGRADCKNSKIESVRDSCNDDVRDAFGKNDHSKSIETPKLSTTSSSISLDENPQSSRRKSVNTSNDVEGTAGWKLSNSPWNLQVIARSPGSLTRFMPDDIPGVTSPMVYIGMLFSWFAWHVEDHELHSMNFLHTGAPKTWYAVPGDYAFTFEEVIRYEAYGGNIDRLAALTLLGEKTTLLSPKVIVASGIPCCRLVQNPGEFVVTFPRAYHVGFSHGFNCGEAANFGTPQWLKVAKEAAVRRAAMNYLPMLSHQQLLYLLTMSFVSRVPRSLLPGARSSRLRDRQKEERELLVKKAFIEDMLKENNTLSVLLGQDSTFYAVLWNPDLLPCAASRESQSQSQLPTITDAVATTLETVSHNHSEKSSNQNILLDEMSLYMETLNDLYSDDDDLSSDFQIDSGALACVACGILGFPFMSVVQPSESASVELLRADLVQEEPGLSEPKNIHTRADPDQTVNSAVPENPFPVPDISVLPKDSELSSITKFNKRWNTSTKYLRPRMFCLEHAVKIEEMLQSKGGANILVICHSDYQKIKAHAVVIAEDIGTPFNCNDVPLDGASQEDLQLIDLAIDDEDHDECSEDWTSKLGINLGQCVKIRRTSPSKQIQHALLLGRLFSEKSSSSDLSKIKWQCRRSRSKKLNHPAQSRICQNIEIKTDEVLAEKLDGIVKKEEKLIQYSRRKFKLKPDSSTGASKGRGRPRKLMQEQVSATTYNNPDGNTGTASVGMVLSRIGSSEGLHEIQVLEATRDVSLNYSPSRVADSLAAATLVVDSVGHIETETVGELNMDDDTCYIAICNGPEMQKFTKDTDVTSEKKEIAYAEKYSSPRVSSADDKFEVQRLEHNMEDIGINTTCNLASKGQSNLASDKDVSIDGISYPAHPPVESLDSRMEDTVLDDSCSNTEVHDCVTSDTEPRQDTQPTNRENDEGSISRDDKLMTGEDCRDLTEICVAEDCCNCVSLEEDSMQKETKTANGHMSRSGRLMDQPTTVSLESSEAPLEESDAAEFCLVETVEKEAPEQEVLATSAKEEIVSGSITELQPSPLSVERFSESLRGSCADKDLPADETLNLKMQVDFKSLTETNVDQLVSTSSLPVEENQPMSASVGPSCELQNEICAEENSGANVATDYATLKEAESNTPTKKGFEASRIILINQPTPALIQKYYRTRRESCSTEKLHSGDEVSLSRDREVENKKSILEEPSSNDINRRKRKREVEQIRENKSNCSGFIRSPCEGLRPRAGKDAANGSDVDISKMAKEKPAMTAMKKPSDFSVPCQDKKKVVKRYHRCDLDGCRMSFETKSELALHKRNVCPHEGCGKRFSSHKYAIIHQRVHDDDRPLKCPWKGCSMSFKWAWARTEHIRVHTGERPYQCKVEGCGLSFRFVSDISRHRRKTGHYEN